MGAKIVMTLVVAAAACAVLVSTGHSGDAGISDTTIGLQSSLHIGASWTLLETNTAGWLQSAAWSGNMFVAVGDYGSILTSPEGTSWDLMSFGIPVNLYDVVWSGGQFVAVGCDNRFPQNCIIRSSDGISWVFASRVSDITEGLYSIACSDSMYIAVGYGGQIFSSVDGDIWTKQTPSDSTCARSFYGITWSGSQFLAVGEVWDPSTSTWNATVASSQDGSEWVYRSLGRLGLLFDVTWTGGQFVAVGYTGVWGISTGLIATSPDGIKWATRRFDSASYLRAVSSVGRAIIAAGDDGIILTSGNGIDWEVRESGTKMTLSGIAASDGRVIIVGTAGTILVSP